MMEYRRLNEEKERCESRPPVPDMAPASGRVLRVPEDNPKIQDAIDAAEAGDTVWVAGGVYEEALVFKEGLRLEGEGHERVMIRLPRGADPPVLTIEDVRSGYIRGFTLESSGENGPVEAEEFDEDKEDPPPVVNICDSCVAVFECVVRNGSCVGIDVWGEGTQVHIKGNHCENNVHGIRVGGGANGLLEDNVCNRNRWDGILFQGETFATAEGNVCCGNEFGIDIREPKAKPTVRKNRCEKNVTAGINVVRGADGMIEENTCTGNLHGIGVLDEGTAPGIKRNICRHNQFAGIRVQLGAKPSLEANDCSGNGGQGIYISTDFEEEVDAPENQGRREDAIAGLQTSVVATGNTCCKNEYDGIIVFAGALGDINENICGENGRNGICVFGSGTEVAIEGNKCARNGSCGIRICEEARGKLRKNRCLDNESAGICVEDHGTYAVVEHNACDENHGQGILVSGVSDAVLIVDNTCDGNETAGIYVMDRTSGKVQQNKCRRNPYGICVAGAGTEPILAENLCEESGASGICFHDQCGGEATKNRCRGSLAGIAVVGLGTAPVLRDNDCSGNSERDISFIRGARPVNTNGDAT